MVCSLAGLVYILDSSPSVDPKSICLFKLVPVIVPGLTATAITVVDCNLFSLFDCNDKSVSTSRFNSFSGFDGTKSDVQRRSSSFVKMIFASLEEP